MILIDLLLNNRPYKALYDTGAQVSIIGDQVQKELKIPITSQSTTYRLPNNSVAAFNGYCVINVQIGKIVKAHRFYILDGRKIIIGMETINKFSLQQNPDHSINQILKLTNDHQLQPKISTIQTDETDVCFRQSISKLMEEFESIFAKRKGEVGRISTEECYINTTTQVPIHLRPYRTSVEDQEKIDGFIEELRNNGLIRKSKSPYGFPALLVDKKDEGAKERLCVDYRALNRITIDEKFPMPRIEDIEDRLSGANYFTTLDISSGFHHIAVAEEDSSKTAFITMNGKYEWVVMPFGLKNAPLLFQRIIYNLLLDHGLSKFAHNYIDDIIIFSSTQKEHLFHIKSVFEMIKAENIKLKGSKCEIAKQAINYLGFRISPNKIEPINSKIQAIKDLTPPHDLRSLRGFLGKTNYYHKFIPNRTEILQPLYEIAKKNSTFRWTKEAQQAFDTVKRILISEPALAIFDPGKKIILKTDASEVGIGAVFKQIDDDDKMVTIAYFSRKLLPYQQRYTISEKECLAIVEAVEYWHYYLTGRKFLIQTDHQPLKYLMKSKHPRTRLFNWSMRLNQYNFEINYIPGKDNEEADYLSRNPPVEVSQLTLQDIKDLQAPIKNEIPKKCILKNGIIYKKKGEKERIYIPQEAATEILWDIHDIFGHLGHCQMNEHFSMKYYTEHTNQIIDEIIKSCVPCLETRKPKEAGTMGQIGPPEEPYDIIFIDTVGGLSGNSEKRYLHLAIDSFTRFVWATSSSTQNAKDFIKLVNKIRKNAVPKLIVADRYRAINSKEFKQYLIESNINIIFTPVDHPQSNGMVERVNQTLVRKLRCKVLDFPNKSWAVCADVVISEYNHSIHSTTKFPPAYLLSGLDPYNYYSGQDLNQNRMKASENSKMKHNQNKNYFDRKHPHIEFCIDEMVMVCLENALNRKKLDPIYKGPFKIIDRHSDHMYLVDNGKNKELIHVSKLKKIKSNKDQ